VALRADTGAVAGVTPLAGAPERLVVAGGAGGADWAGPRLVCLEAEPGPPPAAGAPEPVPPERRQLLLLDPVAGQVEAVFPVTAPPRAVAVAPTRVTTDKAKCYPPALRAVLPGTEHRRSKYLNNGLERDHSHLKQRLYPMRGFKRASCADTLARGHALIRNLRGGFSALSRTVPQNLRLALAWPQLAQAIYRCLRPPSAARASS
jgi:hypothetical protein